ncbi:MAG: hypothetical protein HQK50_19615, partial [Oligoflexia bacterium]|nr:hypothetical protein [Oligoflexia bacterium]
MEISKLHEIKANVEVEIENEVLEFLVSFLSSNTRKAYKRDLTHFYFFLTRRYPETSIKDVTTIQLAIFREYLLKTYSART